MRYTIQTAMLVIALSCLLLSTRISARALPEYETGFQSVVQSLWQTTIPPFYKYATGCAFTSTLTDAQTEAVVFPTYANWTGTNWRALFHGFLFQEPCMSEERIDTLSNIILSLAGVSVSDMHPAQRDHVRDASRGIFTIPKKGHVIYPHIILPSGRTGTVISTTDRNSVTSDIMGDFRDFFDICVDCGVFDGDRTNRIQMLKWNMSKATMAPSVNYKCPNIFLVPPDHGLTFVSDVDDILRIVKTWRPAYAIMTLIAWDFTPWLNMPNIYRYWAARWPNTHFHYLSDCPDTFSPLYLDFLNKHYPCGSFDDRAMSTVMGSRERAHRQVIESFPKRKFVLVADTGNPSNMILFPKLAKEYPQITCILIRNITVTDPSHYLHFDLREFETLDPDRYMFFNVPNDLYGIDFKRGECRKHHIHPVTPPDETDSRVTPLGAAMTTARAWFGWKWWCMWWGDPSSDECRLIQGAEPPWTWEQVVNQKVT
ncbi:hypothetical protein P152DRAFT_292929 [Eremomyces bilateralis CBS 781.70]|uniref:Phosphatidate phosphatase APP1 catalytic domain-containing protein n=1 Tax=Eremomyces bilateralis CBS 781.70 TaxID=1392243 RepID=A0A6G1G6W9_9PEZI|nr:uncharacterized protein P152DRAFT_292929 [Eremomyces bilateralis CBS 781.70]KAF1813817.1 hypothetical protein P152DRAFT_292929 [Eremomyces bilateralis CBS 781.70]